MDCAKHFFYQAGNTACFPDCEGTNLYSENYIVAYMMPNNFCSDFSLTLYQKI